MKVLFSIAIAALAITWAGSYGGLILSSIPLMAWVVFGIFTIQCIAFLPAYLYQTERYYDLVGSLTYISAVLLVLIFSGKVSIRQMLIMAFIIIWAARLGSFLFLRIIRDGSDSRFDKIKPSALLFFRTWMLQGLWVTVTAGAALAALTVGNTVPLNVFDGLAIALWLFGFSVEVIADQQKRQFRKNHGSDSFITTGLWSRSRHPNYFGEITLWVAVALLAFPALQSWQYLTLVSPLFVFLLLTRVSGVPLLEHKSNRRWGEDPAYIAYRMNTPLLVPQFRFTANRR
ncbi:MAG: DUF1295 domain-containing protein [Halioglobus sp.]|nr:DUF1295 domain-containing protein [Halioglobus sp.]